MLINTNAEELLTVCAHLSYNIFIKHKKIEQEHEFSYHQNCKNSYSDSCVKSVKYKCVTVHQIQENTRYYERIRQGELKNITRKVDWEIGCWLECVSVYSCVSLIDRATKKPTFRQKYRLLALDYIHLTFLYFPRSKWL